MTSNPFGGYFGGTDANTIVDINSQIPFNPYIVPQSRPRPPTSGTGTGTWTPPPAPNTPPPAGPPPTSGPPGTWNNFAYDGFNNPVSPLQQILFR
jgi:hypothetical protein